MKLRHLFLAAIVAIGMMACNNEDTPQVNNAESTVSIKVMPSSNGAAVRATGDLSGNGVLGGGLAAESQIKLLEAYVFNSITGALDGYKSATNSNEVLAIPTHPGKKIIVVVANAGTAIGSKNTLDDLQAATVTLDLPVDIVANGLPMTGESPEITLNPGDNQYGFTPDTSVDPSYKAAANQLSGSSPLPITRVNARVAIVDAKLGTLPADQQEIFDNLKNVEVAIFNVPKTTKLFGTNLSINADYLFGGSDGGSPAVNWPSSQGSYTVGTYESTFKDTSVTFPIVTATTGGTDAPYYYVTENTAGDAKQQMLIVLRGKPHKGSTQIISAGLYTDAAGYTYYPVWVNKAGYDYTGSPTGHQANSQIIRNTQYNISLTITKIGNPTIDPVEEAFLDVKVVVQPWTVVNQGVTWN